MSDMLQGSSGNDDIRTPPDFYRELDKAFVFNYDAFSSIENALCPEFSTIEGTYYRYYADGNLAPAKISEATGLEYDWTGKRVFMNPPYSRGLLKLCVEKAISERNKADIIVALIKVDTSTRWWQELALHAHIQYLPKRVRYVHPDPPPGWAGASFASALAIFHKDWMTL